MYTQIASGRLENAKHPKTLSWRIASDRKNLRIAIVEEHRIDYQELRALLMRVSKLDRLPPSTTIEHLLRGLGLSEDLKG